MTSDTMTMISLCNGSLMTSYDTEHIEIINSRQTIIIIYENDIVVLLIWQMSMFSSVLTAEHVFGIYPARTNYDRQCSQ